MNLALLKIGAPIAVFIGLILVIFTMKTTLDIKSSQIKDLNITIVYKDQTISTVNNVVAKLRVDNTSLINEIDAVNNKFDNIKKVSANNRNLYELWKNKADKYASIAALTDMYRVTESSCDDYKRLSIIIGGINYEDL